ncbi:sialomucin core protein 24 isoform X1 [Acipenser ruthenus]|uniref:sialomucin core protein 24 isoform X1 n=1 Tax=Acipenser ruthenus TaxID=7906 RepID=UPI00145BA0DC|nr:sialomucin core protein 24 isoform X1 [Acipenser ruthenus]
MYWKLLFAALTLTVLGSTTAEEPGACSNQTSCADCSKFLLENQTACQWVVCTAGNSSSFTSHCLNKTEALGTNCTTVNATSCTVNSTTVGPPTTTNSTTVVTSVPFNTTTTAVTPTTPHNATLPTTAQTNSTVLPTTAPPKKSSFDAASFIGGIVLVLGLQAVIFFLYKFCKSKDSNYDNL